MNNFFRAIIAGYGAKKLGGGCFGTILVFVLIWVALGQCSFSSRAVPPPETYPADRRAHILMEHEPMDLYACYPQFSLPSETGTHQFLLFPKHDHRDRRAGNMLTSFHRSLHRA